MKRLPLYLMLAALAVCSCAKDPVAGKNDEAKLYFDAWMHVNHPEAEKTGLGIYVLDEIPGTGTEAGTPESHPFVRLDYVMWDLEWGIGATTSEELCKQMGTYEFGDYYGPEIWARANNALTAGVEEGISTMRVGGTKRFIVPGWLETTSRYKTEEEYLKNVTGTAAIYEITLREVITDIKKWEADSIGRYISKTFPGKSVLDSLHYGFYYFQTKAAPEGKSFTRDTTIYVNYVGRLLDGTVFDTNVKDSAKFYGVYSAAQTYGPSEVKISKGENEDLTVKMGSSSVIDGFEDAILQMGPYAKGVSLFYSTLGYGSSGNGDAIPGYAPLRFDIEVVNKS